MIGKAVGPYRITKRIGAGGMGVVYLAEHTLLGRPAAVKMLLPELTADRVVVTRFFNEARAATSIRHPGIVEIYDFGFEPDGAAYIVMEYLQGETLTQRSKRGLISHDGALAIVRQIASALAAAHAKGIIHRDLKPDNVFLVPDPDVFGGERIKLLDFGIAKLTADPKRGEEITRNGDDESVSGGEGHLTRTGAVMGTPAYMAPEQCRGVAVDHRADLYSLGCILFRLCAGKPPFTGAGVGDVLAAHIHVPPPTIASLRPDVPEHIEQLVQRLLIKDPEQRVGSAEEIIAIIEQANSSPMFRTSAQMPGVFSQPPSAARISSPMAAQPSQPNSSPSFPSSLLRDLTAGLPSAPAHAAGAGEPAAPTVSLAPLQSSSPNLGFESPTINTLEGANSGGAMPLPSLKKSRRGLIISASAGAVLALAAVAFLATRNGSTAADDGASSEAGPTAATRAPGAPATPPPPASPASSGNRTAAPPQQPEPDPQPEPTPPPATVEVSFTTVPPGATVSLDGAVLGRTPYRGAIPRAQRDAVFTLSLSGYKDHKLTASALEPVSKTVKLEKKRVRLPGRGSNDSVNPF